MRRRGSGLVAEVIVFGGRLETISGHVRHAQDATFMQLGLAAKVPAAC
jgi:hypothetical protein